MTTFESIRKLSSFKGCKKEVISRSTIGKILEAGRQAPSPGNVQALEFIVVEDEDKKEMLADSVNDSRIAEVPTAVILVADSDRMERHVGNGLTHDFCNAEVACAVQNMRLTAAEEDINSCWISGFDSQLVGDQFGVPSGKKSLSVVGFCYSDSPVESPQKFGLNSVCFYDDYGNQIGSVFDAFEFPGVKETSEIYDKKARGLLGKVRRKLREFL